MSPIVDIHTHIYPPSFISLLQSRRQVPYIFTPEKPSTTTTSSSSPPEEDDLVDDPRLIILPSDDSPDIPLSQRGRPIDSSYTSVSQKLAFMRTHGISASIISLANPWLDFLPADDAPHEARKLNDEMDQICGEHPGKLYAFGTLPLSGPVDAVVAEIHRLSRSSSSSSVKKHIRGVIVGTTGLGRGLDDPALDPVYAALETSRTVVFLHPHYGLPESVYGPRRHDSGHVLPLALGFPVETTIAVTRMLLAGVFDRFPNLQVLLAHSGGTLPFLAGRIQSCIGHERAFRGGPGATSAPKRGVWEILRENVYLDAVVYGDVGLKAAVHAEGGDTGRVLFGTDHPFFPPLEEEQESGAKDGAAVAEWLSVRSNLEAVEKGFGVGTEDADKILGGNAIRIFGLEVT